MVDEVSKYEQQKRLNGENFMILKMNFGASFLGKYRSFE